MASKTSYVSSSVYLRMESKLCSRSHGQPPGERSRSMMATASAKPAAGFWLGCMSGLVGIGFSLPDGGVMDSASAYTAACAGLESTHGILLRAAGVGLRQLFECVHLAPAAA